MNKTENAVIDKMDLQYAADNLPFLIERIIPGMPIRISGDELQLLKIAHEYLSREAERRSNAGRPASDNPTPAALAMRKSREKKKGASGDGVPVDIACMADYPHPEH